jgi:hypothetical protein
MYCRASVVKLSIWDCIHRWSRPNSAAMSRATWGAISMLARASNNNARVRRASASSRVRDIS